MKKTINEEFSPLKSTNPYKIRRDKGYVQDATPQMNQRYLMQKTQEINNFYEKQRIAGEGHSPEAQAHGETGTSV